MSSVREFIQSLPIKPYCLIDEETTVHLDRKEIDKTVIDVVKELYKFFGLHRIDIYQPTFIGEIVARLVRYAIDEETSIPVKEITIWIANNQSPPTAFEDYITNFRLVGTPHHDPEMALLENGDIIITAPSENYVLPNLGIDLGHPIIRFVRAKNPFIGEEIFALMAAANRERLWFPKDDPRISECLYGGRNFFPIEYTTPSTEENIGGLSSLSYSYFTSGGMVITTEEIKRLTRLFSFGYDIILPIRREGIELFFSRPHISFDEIKAIAKENSDVAIIFSIISKIFKYHDFYNIRDVLPFDYTLHLHVFDSVRSDYPYIAWNDGNWEETFQSAGAEYMKRYADLLGYEYASIEECTVAKLREYVLAKYRNALESLYPQLDDITPRLKKAIEEFPQGDDHIGQFEKIISMFEEFDRLIERTDALRQMIYILSREDGKDLIEELNARYTYLKIIFDNLSQDDWRSYLDVESTDIHAALKLALRIEKLDKHQSRFHRGTQPSKIHQSVEAVGALLTTYIKRDATVRNKYKIRLLDRVKMFATGSCPMPFLPLDRTEVKETTIIKAFRYLIDENPQQASFFSGRVNLSSIQQFIERDILQQCEMIAIEDELYSSIFRYAIELYRRCLSARSI